MNTISYLKEIYGYSTPIFLKDIRIGRKSKTAIRKELSRAVENGDIVRKGQGIYCFKIENEFVDSITFEKIVEYKFIKDDFGITGLELNVYGYYTGHTFLNILGISQQVPATLEVATNNTSCKRRFKIKNRETILYKGKIIINRFNYRILQFLDCFYLLTEDDVQEHKQLLKNYIKNNLSKGDFEQYIGLYPSKIFKAIVEGGLLDAFR